MNHSRQQAIAIARVHGAAITSGGTCPVPEEFQRNDDWYGAIMINGTIL